jgi:hypothetical protein
MQVSIHGKTRGVRRTKVSLNDKQRRIKVNYWQSLFSFAIRCPLWMDGSFQPEPVSERAVLPRVPPFLHDAFGLVKAFSIVFYNVLASVEKRAQAGRDVIKAQNR